MPPVTHPNPAAPNVAPGGAPNPTPGTAPGTAPNPTPGGTSNPVPGTGPNTTQGTMPGGMAPAIPATTRATTLAPAPAPAPAPLERRDPWTLHLQGGLFSPIDVNAPSPTVGLRLGRLWLPHLQGGLLTEWTFRRKNLEQPVANYPGLNPQRVLARVDATLVPAMAFIQVNLSEKRFLVPYVAVAAGYEWLSFTATDFRTSEQVKASYANFAWESWGGFGMRLEPRLRADVEVFYNGGKLERDVTDSSGTFTEAVDMNGVGARVGLDILF